MNAGIIILLLILALLGIVELGLLLIIAKGIWILIKDK